MTTLFKFETQLLAAINKNDKFIKFLAEQNSASDEAKKLGLVSKGFGRWGKEDDKTITHKTVDGKLVPIEKDDAPEKAAKKPTSPTGGKKTPRDKKTASRDKKQPGAGKKQAPKAAPQDPGIARAQQAMPAAKLSGRPLRTVPRDQLQQVATRIDDLAKMGQEAKEKGEQAPNYNLCQISIPGTNLFCGDNKGITRIGMPQFKGIPTPGSPADKLPKDKDGEVDTEEFFKQMLEKEGIKVSEPTTVPPDRLKATQSELVGVKVAGMSKVLADKNHPAYGAITAPIYVSHDGYVLDGHHRWAAVVAHNASNPDDQIEMQVRVIDEDILPLVERSNKFAEDIGIRAKAADTGAAGDGKSAESPAPPKETPPEKSADPSKSAPPKLKRSVFDRIKSWGKKQKAEATAFFEDELHKGKTPERRTLVQKIRDKAKGAWKETKHEFKHEKAVFRDAGRGIRSVFRGKKPSARERSALTSVATKVVMTAAVATGLGAAAGGAAALGKAVLIEFIPHVVGESILKGAGKAALFAGPEDTTDDAMMEKFIELVLKNVEEMDIPNEVLEKAFMKYKGDT
jgi:hypothetical protein